MAIKKSDSSDFLDTSPEKKSGYYVVIEGQPKEIVLGKKRGRPPTRDIKNPKWFSMDRKVEACTLYAVYGNVEEVSKLTDIPENHIRAWKQEPWWIELMKQIYIEQNENLGAQINSVLDKTMEHLVDRLDNGDYIYDRKTGTLKRKPVDTKVLTILFDNLAVQRRLNRGEPTSISKAIGVDDRLNQLKESFEKFAKAKEIEGEIVEENNANICSYESEEKQAKHN